MAPMLVPALKKPVAMARSAKSFCSGPAAPARQSRMPR
jgi:hypothetical protein